MSNGTLKSRRAGRLLGAASVAALAFGLLPASPAVAARATTNACPASIPEDRFTDTGSEGTVLEEAVDCLVAYGITAGQGGPNLYGTGNPVTRGQLATFVLNILDLAAGFERPASSTDAFDDDDGTTHEDNINDAAELGIISGFQDGTFRPNAPVTRGQMATFIVNTLKEAGVALPANSPDAFTDDESSLHEANINILADDTLDVVDGEVGGGYNPTRTVTRGNMAFFLTRTLEVLVDAGIVDVFDGGSATVTASPASVPQGGTLVVTVVGRDIDGVTVTGACVDAQSFVPTDDTGTDKTDTTYAFRVIVRPGAALGTCTITVKTSFTSASGTPDETDTVNVTVTQGANAAATTRPELVSAAVVGTNSGAEAGTDGTTVRFTFDEEVTGMPAPVAASFFVLNDQGDRFPGSGTPTIETGGKSVVVTFADVTNDGAAANLTLATVDFGAVRDNESQANPIGDAPLGTATTNTGFTAGQTDAPDLVSVTNVRFAGAAGATQVDFTFDDAAFTANPAGFSLVLVNGTLVPCEAVPGTAGGLPGSGDAGVTRITVACEAPAATAGSVTTDTVARGIVQTDTVSDDQADQADDSNPILGTVATCGAGAQDPSADPCAGATNPLQASDAPDKATTDPDLVSAALVRNTDQSSGSQDSVTYVFDEDVVLPVSQDPTDDNAETAAGRFFVYDVTGAETAGLTAVRGSNPREITVRFADGVIDDAVGASAAAGAVSSQTGATVRANEDDEVGVTNSGVRTTGRTPGRTDGPDLTAVRIGSTGTQVTYAFDEDIASVDAPTQVPPSAGTAGKLFLLQADGTRLVCTAAQANRATEDVDSTITCTAFAFANDAGAATTVTATEVQVRASVVGSVDNDAVNAEDGGITNPEGAEGTTGGSGTPTA